MPTLVKTAYDAIFSVLDQASQLPLAAISPPLRNAALLERVDSQGRWLNFRDDDVVSPVDVVLGEGNVGESHWMQGAEIEWAVDQQAGDGKVVHATSAELETVFDDGVIAIRDALTADPTLGGIVDYVKILPPGRANHALEGLSKTKAIIIPLAIAIHAPTVLG
jgi:hypothetical protein